MAKIAIELERALAQRAVSGVPGAAMGRLLAEGDGWSVEDVICTSGPQDRSFEEQHARVSIAIVAAGTFQYRSATGKALMTPGSLLLGNVGQSFECGHDHGCGDRCFAFRFAPEYFEKAAADAGLRASKQYFRSPRLAPIRALSPVIARACAGGLGREDVSWEEIAVQLAGVAVQFSGNSSADANEAPPGAVARVSRVVRRIEHEPDGDLALATLAREARLSPYHFVRVFEQVTGLTPHQVLLRQRLREAALRLALEPTKILDVAFDTGFGDVSNFNRAFRTEFGVSPRKYRAPAPTKVTLAHGAP